MSKCRKCLRVNHISIFYSCFWFESIWIHFESHNGTWLKIFSKNVKCIDSHSISPKKCKSSLSWKIRLSLVDLSSQCKYLESFISRECVHTSVLSPSHRPPSLSTQPPLPVQPVFSIKRINILQNMAFVLCLRLYHSYILKQIWI